MKRFVLIFLFTILFSNNVLAQELKQPDIDSTSAILMDYKTGRVLWEKKSTEPLAMASTTKIMTAILTIENSNLEDIVTVSKRATRAPKVKIDLIEGEQIKLKYLLYALMLESSNDAAVAIAEHVAGSVEDFCKMMTEKAKDIGCLDTIFETPNGLDAGEHHSTSYDLALIAKYALSNPEFKKLISIPNVTFKSDKKTYSLNNKNRLLNEYEGANGIKTGFTNKAGHCFVGSAKRGDMQLISVVLQSGWGDKGKKQKWIDTKSILTYGFKNYKYYDVVHENDTAGTLAVDRSKTSEVSFYFKDNFSLPLREDERNSLKINIDVPREVKAPIEKDQMIGVAQVYLDGKLYTEVPLLASGEALRFDLKTVIEDVLDDWLELGTKGDVKVVLPEF